jgi:ATP-dependent Clp protease ATP-binding subunit ClpA
MFERFTNPARHVVVLAQEEARQLQHNYIGTEHLLLGLLGEPQGAAFQALKRFGITHDGAREEVKAIIGLGQNPMSGHIPFTPRAKKTLELALREALQLHHGYIGTEHILLGLIKEGKGVAAQILRQHSADLMPIRMTVLDLVPATPTEGSLARGPRWLRRRSGVDLGATIERGESAEPDEAGERAELRTTPAADTSLTEAARLAGSQPVGSHHLLLAAIGDPDTAAARTLAALGVDLERAREALRTAEVTGTSDEQPEEAGRRQMVIRVTEEQVTIEARDPLIIGAGQAAIDALGGTADPPGTIRGDLQASASLTAVWQALHDSLVAIHRRATLPSEAPGPSDAATELAVEVRTDDADQPGDQAQPKDPDQPGNPAPGNEAA